MTTKTKKTMLLTIGVVAVGWYLLNKNNTPSVDGIGAQTGKSDKILFHVYSRNTRALSTYSPSEAVSEAKYYSRIFGESEIIIEDQVIRKFKNGKIVKP